MIQKYDLVTLPYVASPRFITLFEPHMSVEWGDISSVLYIDAISVSLALSVLEGKG